MNTPRTCLKKWPSRLGDFLSRGLPARDFLGYRRPEKRWEPPVTISAACICEGERQSMILAISDRMITSGDTEFEPEQPKITEFAPRIVCLFAGHRDFHHMIASATCRTISADGVTAVSEAAELYAANFVALRRKRAEHKHLAPLVLTSETYLSRQRELNSDLVSALTARMLDESLGVQAIIAGTDADGAHIWTIGVEGGEICQAVCHDGRAFVAIGAGHRQFETQFMYRGYTAAWGSLNALLLMYSAKRRAEVSPGVGPGTDAVFVSNRVYPFAQERLESLDRYSRELDQMVERARREITNRMTADPVWSIDRERPPPPTLPSP
jgi:hypothetical protein